jgi:hypothetical protein
MALIDGYQYFTEQEAINTRENIDAYYKIPISPDSITQNWVEYQLAELNTPQFWYITYDESLLPILGQPQQFEIIQPNPST